MLAEVALPLQALAGQQDILKGAEEAVRASEQEISESRNLEEQGANLVREESKVLDRQDPVADATLEAQERALREKVELEERRLDMREDELEKKREQLLYKEERLLKETTALAVEERKLVEERGRLRQESRALESGEGRLYNDRQRLLRRDRALRISSIVADTSPPPTHSRTHMIALARAVPLQFLLLLLRSSSASATAQGAFKLDNYTLDKVIAIPDHSFLVKVDTTYAYGEKEDSFKALCKLAYGVPNFFPAEVPVQEYGDKDNDDIRVRFGLKKEDFPVYYLFNEANKEGLRYSGEITAEALASWLRKNKVSFPSVDTIEELNVLAKKFLKEGLAGEHVEAAQKLADGEYKTDKKAAVYVKIMQKVKEKGAGYIESETARVKKILKSTVTPEKEAELKMKLKILNMFGEKEEL